MPLEENFDSAELVFSQGRVRSLTNTMDSFEKAAVAQSIIMQNDVDVREGAKILVFLEPGLNRLIFQSHDARGNLRGVYTLLAEKGSNTFINGYLGWHTGPPEPR